MKFPFLKEKKFENQSTVITGGADGIGKAIARRLADEGAEVTIFDLNETSIRATIAEFAEAGLSLHGEIVNIAEETDVILEEGCKLLLCDRAEKPR